MLKGGIINYFNKIKPKIVSGKVNVLFLITELQLKKILNPVLMEYVMLVECQYLGKK